jgi:Do/DeqQ family serine protease
MKSSLARSLAGVALVFAGVLGGLAVSSQFDLRGILRANDAVADSSTADASNSFIQSPFVAVADRVVPGVVAISTHSEAPARGGGRNFHPWGDMFDDLFPNDPRQPERAPRRQNDGAGSGFFMRHEAYMEGYGYVLTNNHVVNNATEVVILLSDDKKLKAEIVGQDPDTDVAVLKVDPKDYDGDLPFLDFGDSDEIRVGDWAVAVGNPFGQLAGSLTVGVISAKGRDDLNIMGGTPNYQDFIQTDASINFGNSGGPLVDIHGRVIGMNTAINAAGQGIGFAIPINMASKVAEELITNGRVVRGYLGIRPQALTPEIAESFDLPNTNGILIGDVVADTPAARAGLETGDVIVEQTGQEVSAVKAFRLKVAELPVGKQIHTALIREGKRRNVDVELEERPDNVVASVQPGSGGTVEWAGISVVDLDSREAQRMLEGPEEAGVLVVGVGPDSPAAEAGIRPGDVIKEIGNMEIADRGDYRSAVKKYEGKKAVAILVKRGNQTLYVGLKP